MCVVSMIGDHYQDRWNPNPRPPVFIPDWPAQEKKALPDIVQRLGNNQTVTREEFDKLAKDVEEMKQLLRRAKEYDERTGQEHCEAEEKVELLRKVAKMVGVDLEDLI